MTFSISFPIVFSNTIGQKDLGESYTTLLGFGMTINKDAIKCKGQYPRLIQVLAILMMLSKHLSFLTTSLRCFHEIQSGPEVDELLHLSMAIVNSFLKKEHYTK